MEQLSKCLQPSEGSVANCHAADSIKDIGVSENLISSWVKCKKHPNPLLKKFPGMRFHHETESIIANIVVSEKNDFKPKPTRVLRAGPTRSILWNPEEVRAAIVTCGGLCPGLNSIIRDITIGLYGNYGMRTPGKILGIRNGYNGFDVKKYPPMILTPGVVEEIHNKGGSILGAGRGGFKPDYIVDTLERLGVNHLYVVGGDGTQWAADVIFQVVKERKLKISIIGIPKTIDNDILFFDRSFGYHSAVDAAVGAIKSAFVEASSCFNGVGIVKLMGRDSGFVARNATLASNLADCCLIPEVEFDFDDLLKHVEYRLSRKGHCVVVVAEGAGQEHCKTGRKDETGHTIYGDIGNLIKDRINVHLKKGIGGRSFFIDPSYIIRSVPATSSDKLFCTRMAHEAVHAAMRGYSGICVGAVHDYMCMVSMASMCQGTRRVNVYSSIWQRTIEATGMPTSLSGQSKPAAASVAKTRGHPSMFRSKPKL